MNFSSSEWSPPVPTWFITDNLDSIKTSQNSSIKITKYIKKLPNVNIPLFPKTAEVIENIEIFWLSKKKLIIETEVHTLKIPMADVFLLIIRLTIEEKEVGKILI